MRSCRRGFTIIEVLVALGIIGILMALLMPAVQQARENARRTTCANNLRQIGVAVQNYHAAHAQFPAFMAVLDVGGPPQTWLAMCLPFLDQAPLYDSLNFISGPIGKGIAPADFQTPIAVIANKTAICARLSVFMCPSDPLHDEFPWDFYPLAQPARPSHFCNYAGIVGQHSQPPWMRLGVFEYWDHRNRDPDAFRSANISLKHVTDGASHTLYALETRSLGLSERIPGVDDDFYWARVAIHWFNPSWWGHRMHWECGDPSRNPMNGGILSAGPTMIPEFCLNPPFQPVKGGHSVLHSGSSFHPGGANGLFCDGSVRFLPNEVCRHNGPLRRVFYALLTKSAGDAAEDF